MGVIHPGETEVNAGTGAFVLSLSDAPDTEKPSVICNAAAIPGKFIREMNVLTSAASLNWLIDEFFPEFQGDPPDFEALNRIAAETPPGANGLFTLPLFQGCGSRDWNPSARAMFYGFSLQSKRTDMIRALYEGIGTEISSNIKELKPGTEPSEHITLSGGLSRSDIFLQILSDITGSEIRRPEDIQSTALGACISAAAAMGAFNN